MVGGDGQRARSVMAVVAACGCGARAQERVWVTLEKTMGGGGSTPGASMYTPARIFFSFSFFSFFFSVSFFFFFFFFAAAAAAARDTVPLDCAHT
jgi:hypothetical protein